MRTVATSTGRGGLLVAASLWLAVMALAVMPGIARAQFFSAPSVPRPPADVPSAPPLGPQNLTAPDGGIAPPVAPRPAPVLPPPSPPPTQAAPSVPPGQVTLAVTARYGRDMPAISGGLHWRIYPSKPDQTGAFRVITEDKGPNPVFTLPPGGYVVSGRVRARERDQGGAVARRTVARGVRNPGRRPAHRRQGRRRPHSARAGELRSLQGQPVRARRQAADRAVGHGRAT